MSMYNPEQKALIDAPLTGTSVGLAMAGTGKSQNVNEPILTPTGWTTMGDLKVGDFVIGSNGKPVKVLQIHEKGIRNEYRITFQDGSTTTSCDEHLWTFESLQYKHPQTHTLAEWMKRDVWVGKKNKLHEFYLPTLQPVQFENNIKLPIDPYLLGAFIADAHLKKNRVEYAKNEESVFNHVISLAQNEGYNVTKVNYTGVNKFTFKKIGENNYKNELTEHIRELQLNVNSPYKFIPDIYKFTSIENRMKLINGLFDGDGSIRKRRGTARYTTTSLQLAKDVIEVLRSLGVIASLQIQKHKKGNYYQVNVLSRFDPFGVSRWHGKVTGPKRTARRSVSKIEYVGKAKMRCISVDAEDSLYVTNDYILTHNTYTMLARTTRILKEYTTGRILLISFTRMAANDLRMKIARTVPEHEMRRIEVGTFHSVIGKLIRNNAVAVGLQPSVSIIDENSTTTMYKSIVENNPKHLKVAESWFINPQHKKLLKRDFNKIARAVSTLVNTAQPEELETGQFSKDTLTRVWKIDPKQINDYNIMDIVNMLHAVFIESLKVSRETNTLNYDHILFIGYLMAKSGLLNAYSEGLVHVIVDEYQDTNALQDAFIRAIAKDKLTIIGDENQAIYEFRGGRTELIGAHADEGQVYNLTYNYRSYQPILDLANKVIKHNQTGAKYRKDLRATIDTDDGYGGITYVKSSRDAKESDFVINKIKFLLKKGVPASEIAILVRSRMSIASINLALQKEKIVVNDTTKFADFMNSDIMVDTLNFVKIFTNPQDIYAFMAVLDRPARGIGPKAIETLMAKAREHKLGIIEFILSDFVEELTPALQKKTKTFADVYGKLINADNQMEFPEAIDFLLKETGYVEWIKGLKNNETHLRNLNILTGLVEDFYDEYKNDHNSFTLFDVANAFTFEMTSSIRQQDNDGIVIATIHGAKGLEWDHVFILGMEEQGFPGNTLDDADMESERRLMYVAITRAKKSLTLCSSEYRITFGDSRLTESRFIQEAELDNPIEL